MSEQRRERQMPPDDAEQTLPEYAERVLEVAELIPPGRVMTYGDVAEWLEEGGPRQVGRVMGLYGGGVPWWRVVRSDGALLPGHELRALEHYREEGTPLRQASRAAQGHVPKLDMRRARWDGSEVSEGRPLSEGRDVRDMVGAMEVLSARPVRARSGPGAEDDLEDAGRSGGGGAQGDAAGAARPQAPEAHT
ncbi:MGMT family protein [Streptomyces sp. WAC 01529]|uniref:MGMT family protein n=1 Tax=Streptomyces sp. WAC 01529 TaxID=2203205 RepID=UPI0019D21F17|nr:MGMT family protein [Streptomyces sp. WAC 01529]